MVATPPGYIYNIKFTLFILNDKIGYVIFLYATKNYCLDIKPVCLLPSDSEKCRK